MSSAGEVIQIISGATALRLYNSVAGTNQNGNRTVFTRRASTQAIQQMSLESITSSNSFNTSCRICRWNRSDMEIVKCPCLCKGSVGFIHLPCLKRWIMHRRDNHCEICNASFDIQEDKMSMSRMFKSFFRHCFGPILKHLLFGATLMPLIHIILQQVVICTENLNLNPNEDLTFKQVVVASTALMTSSAVFFHFFEFITTRIILIRNILRQWWSFGNSTSFALLQTESDILDLFT